MHTPCSPPKNSGDFFAHYRRWLNDGAPAPLNKPPVIWLELNACSGDTIALMDTQNPNLGQILTDLIDLRFSNALLPAEDDQAITSIFKTASQYPNQFLLFIEGAIPLAGDGLYTIPAESEARRLTALELIQEIGYKAKHVVAAGTCACYGGPSAARPNPSGSVGVQDVLKREIINVSGCPNNPDWIVGTLYHLLYYAAPALDEAGRPLLFYQYTAHTHCQRRSYFDREIFADELGEIECMYKLGCMGPATHSDCPYRQWNDYVNWPVRANTPCIGCTNTDFPDGSMPFFQPLPEKRERSESGQGGDENE